RHRRSAQARCRCRDAGRPREEAQRRFPPLPRPGTVLMSAQILDGRACAKQIKAELTETVADLGRAGVVPGLGTVLVGEDPGSKWYVAGKHRDCAEVGIHSI